MNGSRLYILDPVARPRATGLQLAKRPADIRGMTVGYLDNGWWSFGLFIDRFRKRLAELYSVGGAIHLQKVKSSPATKQIEELSQKCQLIVNGLGN